jgi:Lrp/AsnC family transcriptional regulator, regulator for asnA, asnC and gidA
LNVGASATDSLAFERLDRQDARQPLEDARDQDPRRRRVSEQTAVVLDDVSKLIVEQLQQDGRRPYAAIAKAVGLSEAAVRQRVQRLLDHGVMQIVAVTDPLRVGFQRQAMVGLKVEGDLRDVARQLAAVDEVDYVVVCAGSFDVIAEIVCEDDKHLLGILNDRIRTIQGVTNTETFVYLSLEKQTYTWGTR